MPARVFLVCAPEDHRARELLVQQARRTAPALEFEYIMVKQPWIASWKAQCRAKALKCDGAIVLVGKKTHQADGIPWELECVYEVGLPVLALHVDKHDKGKAPAGLTDPVVDWDAARVNAFLRILEHPSAASA